MNGSKRRTSSADGGLVAGSGPSDEVKEVGRFGHGSLGE